MQGQCEPIDTIYHLFFKTSILTYVILFLLMKKSIVRKSEVTQSRGKIILGSILGSLSRRTADVERESEREIPLASLEIPPGNI